MELDLEFLKSLLMSISDKYVAHNFYNILGENGSRIRNKVKVILVLRGELA